MISVYLTPFCRKHIQLQKSSIQKLWMRRHINRKLEVLWTPEWVLLTEISSVKLVERVCQSVLVTLGISNWRALFSIRVSILMCAILSPCIHLHLGFIVKVKKILECICVNCGRLKADSVSYISFHFSFRTPPPNFLGALSAGRRTPSPYCVSPH